MFRLASDRGGGGDDPDRLPLLGASFSKEDVEDQASSPTTTTDEEEGTSLAPKSPESVPSGLIRATNSSDDVPPREVFALRRVSQDHSKPNGQGGFRFGTTGGLGLDDATSSWDAPEHDRVEVNPSGTSVNYGRFGDDGEDGEVAEVIVGDEAKVEVQVDGDGGSEESGVPRSLHRAPRVADVIKEIEQRKTSKPKKLVIYLKNYYKILLLVGIFYSLPSIQFVIFQYEKKDEAKIDCYFNFKCVKPLLGFDAFNNIVSNSGYIAAALFFGAFVWATKLERLQVARAGAGYGLHDDRSLYYCIALAICFEGIFSGLYHVCPSRINFQFDTTFMIIGSGLLFVTLFQKRHPASAPGAVRVFVFFAIIVFLNFLALSRIPTPALWAIVFVVLGATTLMGSTHIYNHRKIPLKHVLYNITHFWPINEPGRLIMILIGNGLSGALLIVSAVNSIRDDNTEDFPTMILGLFVLNTFVYLIYYIIMKIRHREKVHWLVYILFLLVIGFWASGLWFFEVGVTNKFLSPEESRKLNKPCIVFDYFDYHDVWHFLSAAGLVAISMLVYVLDFGLGYA